VVDSGDGGHADHVHNFTRSRFARRVVSGKGVGRGSRPFLKRSSTKGARLFLVGVDAVKAQLFNRLVGGNAFCFSADLELIFLEQLTREQRFIKYFKGQPVRRFERIAGKRA
jgi:phage terminase large subunit GpA-like protein